MAPSSLVKHTADCESPHNWLMSLAMDLAALCDMWGWNGSNLAVFREDIAFSHHFITPCLLPPNRSASDTDYTSKKLSKMAGNPAIHPVYSRYSELRTLNSYRFVEKHAQAALIILEIYWIEYFKIIFLNTYNSMYKAPLFKSSHI